MKLKEVCDVYSGYAFKNFNDSCEGLPVIKIGNINSDGTLDLSEVSFTTDNFADKYKSSRGDIYVALSGATTGKVGIMNSEEVFAINQRVGIVRTNNKNIPVNYVKHFLISKTEKILSDAAGAAQPNISPKQISDYDFPSISKEIMLNRADSLDKIENIIFNLKHKLNLLDELVKARFVEMFEEKNYTKRRIDEVCTLKSGTTFEKDKELESGAMLYCKVSDMNLVGNEKYMTTSKTYVSLETAKKAYIPKNSVIFPKRGGAIGTNKKRILSTDTCVDLNTMGVTPKEEINIQYLYQYFQNIDLLSLSDGSAIPQLNNKNIGPLMINVPPINVQEQFSKFVEQIDKSKFNIQKQIDETQKLFDKLMQDYFG